MCRSIKIKFYSRAMRKMDKKAADFAQGKISTGSYARFVVRLARKQGINVAREYPEVAKWTGLRVL